MHISESGQIKWTDKNLLIYESKSFVGIGFLCSLIGNEPARDTSNFEEKTRHEKIANVKVTKVVQQEQEMLAVPGKETGATMFYSEIMKSRPNYFFNRWRMSCLY